MTFLPHRLPRTLHPAAWWLWALAMAAAASTTTNPLLLGLVIAVVAIVVVYRRGDASWARGFGLYLALAAVVVAIRVVFRALFGSGTGEHVLFTLPQLTLPEAAAGIRIGGPVTLEGVAAAGYDGLRLATMIVCLGAAQTLAHPRRLLKSLPGALHEVGTAVIVALTVAPQLVESVQRVRRARRLRGASGRGLTALRAVLVPVLEDALDRSVALAAAMDSRGYGRVGDAPRRERVTAGTLLLGGLVGLGVGVYGVLDTTAPALLGAPALAAGVAGATAGLAVGGRHVRRTVHRPVRWSGAEWIVVASGVAAALTLLSLATLDPAGLHPSTTMLAWPSLPLAPASGLLLGLLPVVTTPPVPRMPGASG